MTWFSNEAMRATPTRTAGVASVPATSLADLNACRMIVNVHKHGDGPSLDALAKNYPQYLPSPLSSFGGQDFVANNNPTHEDLKVEDQDLDRFSGSVVEFWRAVPENVTFGEVKLSPPAWFAKAYNKSATAGATS